LSALTSIRCRRERKRSFSDGGEVVSIYGYDPPRPKIPTPLKEVRAFTTEAAEAAEKNKSLDCLEAGASNQIQAF